MILKYVNKIRANISIYASKKATNILDGTYKSVYRGKSMNFENLREYVINDEVKDIDWKASARSGKLLVKQFIAEKKHNIMLIMDTGKKMAADTDLHENKKDIALLLGGTIGYLAIENGDYVGMVYTNKKVNFKPFKLNLYNLEFYLAEYDKIAFENNISLNDTLKYVFKNIHKKMIIFVITDIDGISKVENKTLKEIKQLHDILFLNINDNLMTGNDIYDIEQDEYIPNILLNDAKLNIMEKEIKEKILNGNKRKMKKNNISMVSISSKKEINDKIIRLLEEHHHESRN